MTIWHTFSTMKNDNKLLIHVDQLKNGEQKEIQEKLPPEFLELESGDEIKNKEPISVYGTVYVTDDYLILDLNIEANLILMCGFCTESYSFPVKRTHFMHEEPLETMTKGVFDLGNFIRETVLLEVPLYPLCGGKECKNRKKVEKFLSQKKEEHFHPFQDL
jgi:uncharacterized metal-binding protein YceD (DUF177 family)